MIKYYPNNIIKLNKVKKLNEITKQDNEIYY